MAFSYRTPAQELLSCLPSEDQTRVNDPSVTSLCFQEKNSSNYYSYNLSDCQKMFCSKVGVPLSVQLFKVHPHPYCKTMENFLLYDNLYHYRSMIDNYVSIKVDKVNLLKRGGHRNGFVKIINRVIADRDVLRYGPCGYNKEFMSEGFLSSEKGKSWFFHDELHHWNFEDLKKFIKRADPERILATLVIPPEIFQLENSMNPSFYDYDIIKKNEQDKSVSFNFYPDGSRESAYFQKTYDFWFKMKYLNIDGQFYTVSFMRSIKCHHMILIEKGKLKTNPFYVSDFAECINAKMIGFSRISHESIPIRELVFKREIIYLMSLKKPDMHSATAKLRMLSSEDYTTGELLFFNALACEIDSVKGLHTDVSLLKHVQMAMLRSFPKRVRNHFCKGYKESDFEQMLMNSNGFQVKIKRYEYPRNCLVETLEKFLSGDELESEGEDEITIKEDGRREQSRIDNRIERQYLNNKKTLFIETELPNKKKRDIRIKERLKEDENIIKKNKRMRELVNKRECSLSILEEKSVEEMMFALPLMFRSKNKKFRVNFCNLYLGVNEVLIYSRKTMSYHYREGDKLLSHKGFDEIEHEENERKEKERFFKKMFGQDEIKEVEMDEEDPESEIIDSRTFFVGESSNSKQIEMGMDDILDCSTDESIDEIEVAIENNKFTCSDSFKDGLKNLFKSKESLIHENLNAIYISKIELASISIKGKERVKNEFLMEPEKILNRETNSLLILRIKKEGKFESSLFKKEEMNLDYIEALKLKGHVILSIRENGISINRDLKLEEIENVKLNEGTSFEFKNFEEEDVIVLVMFKQTHRADGSSVDSLKVRHRELPSNLYEITQNLVNGCFIDCLCDFLKMSRCQAISVMYSYDDAILDLIVNDKGFTVAEMINILIKMDIPGVIFDGSKNIRYLEHGSYSDIFLRVREDHVSMESLMCDKTGILNIDESLEMSGANRVHPSYSVERARVCMKSLQEGATGIVLTKFKFEFNKILPNHSNKTFCISGFAGSGKSRGIQDLCCGILNSENVILISPRSNLRNDWENKIRNGLNNQGFKIKLRTYETGIVEINKRRDYTNDKPIIIIDEVSLLPGGYIDLINSIIPEGSTMVLIFDPLQSSYYSPKAAHHSLPDIFEPLYGQSFDYKYYSYRFGNLFKIEGLSMMGGMEISEHHMKVFKQPEAVKKIFNDPIFISPSEAKANELRRYGDSYTFGTSQGLTFDFVVISIDMDGPLVSNAHWMVALTRARKGFAFVVCSSITLNDFKNKVKTKIIGKVLNKTTVSKDFMRASGGKIMDHANLIGDSKKGRTREEFEDTLENDPWIKTQLIFLESPELQKVETNEMVFKSSPPRTHLMISSEENAFINGPHLNKAREFREFRGRGMWSEQFDDCRKERKFKYNRAETFETIYPNHNGTDSLTMWAAIKKRLKMSDPYTERRKLERLMSTGKSLFEIFRKEYCLRRDVRVNSDEIYADFIDRRLNKSKALISAHSERSDPDWICNHFFLFMKTQLCTKYEKRFSDAKAGQTLACFSHSVLTRFGVPIKEVEERMRFCLKDNIYIHSGKKLDELNNWCIKYATGYGTDSDYESFDRSQDALILAFEIHLLEFFGWTKDLIYDYVSIKLRLGCRLGNLAIMRFTGEFGTFFLNTCCNMLFTCLRYKFDSNTPFAFAGDDMFSPKRLDVRHDREFLLKRFSLKAKVNFSRKPMFCGWRMSKYGIVKEPRLVLERFEIAKERGILKECLINYCLEVSFAYRLGDKLYEVIDNIEDQQELVRFVVKKKHLLPPKVRKEFESYDHEFGGCESVQEEGECNRVHSFGCGLECNL